jgi:Leucine-rich repeat (LRR) protein
MRYLIILLFVSGNTALLAQSSDTTFLTANQLKKEKPFTDLDKALKNPEKVIVLDLTGKSLEELPESIGSFKNLQVLRLGYGIKPGTPKRIIRKSKHIGGGILHLDRGTGKYVAYNQLTQLPDTLASLTKLQYIDLNNNAFTDVPMILKEIETLTTINFYGCYSLMDNKAQIEELKTALGENCTVFVTLND